MEEFFTVNQAAISLKVHPLTIRRYIKEGKLKAVRVGGNVRVAVNDLRNLAQNFIPRIKTQTSQNNEKQSTQVKSFNGADPLLILRGRGISMERASSE